MKRIDKICYQLETEGKYIGRAAVMVYFAEGEGGTEWTDSSIIEQAAKHNVRFMVLKGCQFCAELDSEFIARLQSWGFYVVCETDGSKPVPDTADYITLKPTIPLVVSCGLKVTKCDQLIVEYQSNCSMEAYSDIIAFDRFLRPCEAKGVNKSIVKQMSKKYCLKHPEWRLIKT